MLHHMSANAPSAEKAIALISFIHDELGPAAAAFLVGPNVVLTLAGARPICDQVYYSTQKKQQAEWLGEIETVLAALQDHTSFWAKTEASKNPVGDSYVSYDALFADGLAWALSQTPLLSDDQKTALLAAPLSEKLFDQLTALLAHNNSFRHLSGEQRQHIASGILLGYPDKAILGSVELWDADPFHEQLIAADIRGASYYPCPQPVYDYPRSLISDPSIQAHEQLWNTILKDFYQSDFHQMLSSRPAFKHKIAELGP